MIKIEDAILTGEVDPKPVEGLLIVKTANQCIRDAQNKPIPRKLFLDLWHEGELAILFADTNVGKSILAVQIADQISQGKSDGIFIVDAEPQVVLYLDFELSDKQFENRYSDNYQNHHVFHDNLLRVYMNPKSDNIDDFDKEIELAIEQLIIDTGAKVLIVDNISFLKTQSNDTAKEASPLMKRLIQLKNQYGIAILALAHTPKRDERNPIEINHLAGSKILSNFVDSIFAIGQSFKDPSLRYIKQLKARDTEKFYGTDYVIVCKVEKNINYLCLNHVTCESEREHLKHVTENEKQDQEALVIQLFKDNPELSIREIARQADISDHKRVKRILVRNGLIESEE
jgi:RecA-family ATPase